MKRTALNKTPGLIWEHKIQKKIKHISHYTGARTSRNSLFEFHRSKNKEKNYCQLKKSDDLKYVRNVTAVTSCKNVQDVKANLNTTN